MTIAERLLVAALALALFLPGIAARDVWNPDEPRYAEVALEMRETGSWFVPRLNGRVYSEKPPLHFWSIALVSAVPGVPIEAAARIPSLIAAMAALLLLGDLAARLLDRRAAWPAVLVLAGSTKFLWQGRVGQIDMTLLALVTAAMWCFVRGLVEERPGFHRGFFLFAGLATLAKGPVGLLPPLLGIVLFALGTGRRRLLGEMRIPTGLLIWAAVVMVWLVPAGLTGGREYLETIVFKQNVTRYADPWHHFKPWYYYLQVLPADFFPWSFFLPGAIAIGQRRSTAEARRGYELALCWAIATLVFFSLSPAKRTVYVLTMYPALALLVAGSLVEIEWSWPRLRRFLTIPAGLVALLLTALVAAGALAAQAPPERWAARIAEARTDLAPMGPGLLPVLGALGAVAAGAAVAAWWAARRGRTKRMAWWLTAGFGFLASAGAVLVLPRFDAVKSARPMAARLVELAPPGEPYAIWPRLDAEFLVYSRRFAVELPDEEGLHAFAARPGRVWLLVRAESLARLERPLPLVEVAREESHDDGYVLMRSPGPEPVAPSP
jgi:hypothetical protein